MSRSRLEDVLPLSPLQEGLWFHALRDADADEVYNTQLVLELAGEVDPERLRAALRGVLARHANLRVGFRQRKDGQPIQYVVRDVEPAWEVVDLTAAELPRFLAADRVRRFDVRTPPLLRCTLVRSPDRTSRLVITNHHLLLDGWSAPLLIDELFALYRGRTCRRSRRTGSTCAGCPNRTRRSPSGSGGGRWTGSPSRPWSPRPAGGRGCRNGRGWSCPPRTWRRCAGGTA